MGNSSSSSGRGHHEDTVDLGCLSPQGVYTGPRDWNQAIVTQLICERRLAPFYRPLEEYDENWDDDQILAARKEPQDADGSAPSHSETASMRTTDSSSSKPGHHKRPSLAKEPGRCSEATVYRGAVECPICFLYYPPNINHSRCCDQAICTECFVQIKRAEPTTTHLVSEPAACPYCVQENFGVVYTPPMWRAGIGSEGATPPWSDSPKESAPPFPTHKRRQKSFGHDSPEVVTTDQIRPDWEAKLAAVRAAVARRANRRIIMRQVGDRLIPVGVTSGRVHALPTEDGQGGGDDNGGSRRSRRRQHQNQDINHILGTMGLGGQDLEELMIMEAMRLSLLEHEEQQRKEAAEKAKDGQSAEGEGSPQEETSTNSASDISHATASSSSLVDDNAPPTLQRPLVPTTEGSRSVTPTLANTRSRTPTPSTPGTSTPHILNSSLQSSPPLNASNLLPPAASSVAISKNGDATTSEASIPVPSPSMGQGNADAGPPVIINGVTIDFDSHDSHDTPSPGSIRPTGLMQSHSYSSSILSDDDDDAVTGPSSSYNFLTSSSDLSLSQKPLMETHPDHVAARTATGEEPRNSIDL